MIGIESWAVWDMDHVTLLLTVFKSHVVDCDNWLFVGAR